MKSSVYLHIEDACGTELRIDEKHCIDDELRLKVDGQEFFLSPSARLKIIQTLAFSLEEE